MASRSTTVCRLWVSAPPGLQNTGLCGTGRVGVGVIRVGGGVIRVGIGVIRAIGVIGVGVIRVIRVIKVGVRVRVMCTRTVV